MKNIVFFITAFLWLNSGFTQNNATIYKAYCYGDIAKWQTAMQTLPKATNADILSLINYQYGYIGVCLAQKNKTEAKKYIANTAQLLKQLEKAQYNLSSVYAYKAALIGYKIGISPYKAPFISSKSSKYAKKAVALDSLNPLGYIQLGNISYHTPSIFGGSNKTAIKHFCYALKLMEQKPQYLTNNWNYLNLLATLIKVYIKEEAYQQALQNCQKVLKIAPEFKLVKHELYPQVIAKRNK